MCLYPKTIENRKYRATKKNGGIIPPVNDNRIRWVQINCEQCIECRKQKARAWQVRLLEDIKTNKNGKFITLTFSNESIQKLNQDKILVQPRLTKKTCLPARVHLQRKYYRIKLIPIQIKNLIGYEKDNAIATRKTTKATNTRTKRNDKLQSSSSTKNVARYKLQRTNGTTKKSRIKPRNDIRNERRRRDNSRSTRRKRNRRTRTNRRRRGHSNGKHNGTIRTNESPKRKYRSRHSK